MESSLKQFGVICHQSQYSPPELGFEGKMREKERAREREGVGPLYYLSTLHSE